MVLRVEASWGRTRVLSRAEVKTIETKFAGRWPSRPPTQLPGPIAKRSLPGPSLLIFDGDYLIRLEEWIASLALAVMQCLGRAIYTRFSIGVRFVWHRHSCLCPMGIVMNAGTDRSVCATDF